MIEGYLKHMQCLIQTPMKGPSNQRDEPHLLFQNAVLTLIPVLIIGNFYPET